MSAAKPKLFFIGVGNMGNPMAANLVKAGYAVTVFDVTRAKADNLLALGATWVNSLAEGAAQADGDADGREQKVLGLEVAQDLAARGAQRAPHADGSRALLHPKRLSYRPWHATHQTR